MDTISLSTDFFFLLLGDSVLIKRIFTAFPLSAFLRSRKIFLSLPHSPSTKILMKQ